MNVLSPDIPDKIDSLFAGLIDAEKSGWFQEKTNEFFRGFPVSPEDTVLDVGCGKGDATVFCAKCGANVIYADIEADEVARVSERLAQMEGIGETLGLVGDSNPLKLDDQAVSRIMCIEVLEHVDDPRQVIAEMVRVGKPGALYLLTVPGTESEYIQKKFAPEWYFQKPNHIRIFSRQDFEELVKDSGLVIQSYDTTGFFWVTWMSIYWATMAASGEEASGDDAVAHKKIEPPFDESLNRWAALWVKLILTPEGLAFKREMDKLLPRNQIIIAQKPE